MLNPGPGLGYAQKCGRAKLVNEIQILLSRKLDLSPMAIHINVIFHVFCRRLPLIDTNAQPYSLVTNSVSFFN
jgi:hypothetical protein